MTGTSCSFPMARRTFCMGLAAMAMPVAARRQRQPAANGWFDAHAHVTSGDQKNYPISPLDGALAPGVLDDLMTAERLIALMEENGIRRSLLVQRAHVYGFDNRYVLDCVAQYPERFQALCMVNAEASDSEAVVKQLMTRPGVVGIRMTSPAGRQDVDWFAGKQALAAWRATIDAGGSIRLHMYSWNRLPALAALDAMLVQFPRAKVVVDHVAGTEIERGPPDYGIDEALLRLIRYPDVSIMFSMINQRRLATKDQPAAPLIRRLVSEFGASRILWGSDAGNTRGDYAAMVRWALDATASIKPEERVQLLGSNARRIYPSEVPQA